MGDGGVDETVAPAGSAAARASAGPVSLVYIAGAHRSGATPLGAVLGGNPEVFFAGELYRIPHPIFEVRHPDRLCSCGVAVDDCPFWTQVRSRLATEPGLLSALRAGQIRFERPRTIFRTLWRRYRRDPELLAHIARMGRFVRILSEISGARVVVESSYNPLRGWLYRDPASGLEVKFLHLVRDGRNFLNSERSATDPPETAWKGIRTTPAIVLRWVGYHLLTLALLGGAGGTLRFRFEDLVTTPGPVLRRTAAFVGVDLSGVIPRVAAGEAIQMRHIASGNRMRLRGEVRLQREFADLPSLRPLTVAAFWVLAGGLALALGYRPRWGPVGRAAAAKATT